MDQTKQGPLRSVRFLTRRFEGWSQQKSDRKMKDETNILIVADSISLNPKVYSFNHQTIDEFNKMRINSKRTLKGVSKVVAQKETKHDDYLNMIETNEAVKQVSEASSIKSTHANATQ